MAFKQQKNKKQKKKQYITTFTVKFQTFKSIYQIEEYKSWSLVPCIPHELKAGASSQCDHFIAMYSTLCLLFIQCDVIVTDFKFMMDF